MMPPVSWERDLEEVRRRLAALDAEAAVADRRRAVATWRGVESFSTHFLPLPVVVHDVIEPRGAWAPLAEGSFGEAVGLDPQGRPVLHLFDAGSAFERAKHLWWWEDDSFLELELMGSGPHLRRARTVDGRLAHVACVSRGGDLRLWILRERDEQTARAEGAEASAWQRPAFAMVRRASFDDRGRLWRVEEAIEEHEMLDEPADPDTPAAEQGFAAALARAAELEADQVVWDGTVRASEPWPGLTAAEELVEPLARALDGALRAAVAKRPFRDAFVLVVAPGVRHDDALFPGVALLGSTAFRDKMRAATDDPVLQVLWRGVETGDVVELQLAGDLDEDALRACRVLSTALGLAAREADAAEADVVVDALGDRLAELLHDPPVLEGCVALVGYGARHAFDRGLERARRILGPEPVAALQGHAARRAAPDRELVERATGDRAALEELLAVVGLADDAHRMAHEIAAPGLLLEPADGVRSRLGGPPLLPAGEPWPATGDGVPLSFLAALDLAELPSDGPLPASGWLLFYAALDPDNDGLIDEAENAPGACARVLVVPPGNEPVPAELPAALRADEWAVLRDRPVRPRTVLTVPDGYDAGSALGLDVYAARTYDDVVGLLRGALDGESGRAHHWVYGHATGVQGHPNDPDSVLLLHIEHDSLLGFEFLDGGTIQFRIPAAALAERDWSQAVALADSC
jgi:Domain of unknown function (DUF1963)